MVQQPQVMYNLTVAEAHTFFVGDGQWLVHNHCGLRDASKGLKALFADGTVRGRSIIGIRSTLRAHGFTQTKARGFGYLFEYRHPSGSLEQVRIMRRQGAWDMRLRNQYGNYLDEFGHVPQGPSTAHNIPVYSK